MIFTAIKYWLTTPIVEIRGAMKRYRALVQYCHDMQAAVDVARQNLIVDVPVSHDFENHLGCLKYKYFNPILNYGMDDGDNRVAYDICACPKFTETHGTACTNVACPYALNNLKYFMALQDYDAARKKYKNFWRREFVRTK